jgi:hypothetical protein
MNILQLQEKHIYNYLQPVFFRHGYEKISDKKQFRQQNLHGFKNVQFSLSGDADGQLIKVQLGVRLNKVERLVEQFLEGTEEQPAHNQTVVASLSRFYKQEKTCYLLTDEKSLQHTCQEIAEFMQKKGFRFLESISKLRHIDALINRKPNLPSPFMYNQIHRCFKGIAIASILHRTNFEKLVSIYSNYLYSQWAPREVVDSYTRLVNYLRYFSFN